MRLKIYDSIYWKEDCFGLDAEKLVDKAMELDHIGGTYGGNRKPTHFICLILKMLQIQPEKDIIIEFIQNEDYKYVRALGVYYMRLIGKPLDVYHYLEPLYNDFRKLRYKTPNGWTIIHMDEFVEKLLNDKIVLDVTLPPIISRLILEERGELEIRKSLLDEEYEDFRNEDKEEEEEVDKEEEGEIKDNEIEEDDSKVEENKN